MSCCMGNTSESKKKTKQKSKKKGSKLGQDTTFGFDNNEHGYPLYVHETPRGSNTVKYRANQDSEKHTKQDITSQPETRRKDQEEYHESGGKAFQHSAKHRASQVSENHTKQNNTRQVETPRKDKEEYWGRSRHDVHEKPGGTSAKHRASQVSENHTKQNNTRQVETPRKDKEEYAGRSEHNDGDKQTQKLQEVITKLREELNTESRKFQDLKDELEKCKRERNDYRDRLSERAATKLTDNNPNITNLGDINRPQKLAEKFSELYDNQYTDAFQSCNSDGSRTDEQICTHLLQILKETFNTCSRIADDQLQVLEKNIKSCIGSNKIPEHLVTHIKMYKEERKKNFRGHFPSVEQAVRQQLQEVVNPTYNTDVVPYIEEASHICWLMCIQDPPMTISFCHAGDKFDKSRFKPYTELGKTVAYMVWPALCQYEGGPLITKGVAQGKNYSNEIQQGEGYANNDRKGLPNYRKDSWEGELTSNSQNNRRKLHEKTDSQNGKYVTTRKDGTVVSDILSSETKCGTGSKPRALSVFTDRCNKDERTMVYINPKRPSTGIHDVAIQQHIQPKQMQFSLTDWQSGQTMKERQPNVNFNSSYQQPRNDSRGTKPHRHEFAQTYHYPAQAKSRRSNATSTDL